MSAKANLSVTIDAALDDVLRREADRTRRPLSYVVNDVLWRGAQVIDPALQLPEPRRFARPEAAA